MTYNPLAEKTAAYIQALVRYLSNTPQKEFGRFRELQNQAYEALHLKERPKAKPLKSFKMPLDGTPPEMLARKIVTNGFDDHPFYIETFSERISRPYEDSEPDMIMVEVYPSQ